MIINATTGTGFGGALSYVYKEKANLEIEQKPEILEQNHVSGTPKEQSYQMRFVANGNNHSSRPVLHLAVSFSPKEVLNREKVNEVLNQTIKEFGATKKNNQYVILKHNDSDKEHYHIIINKVGFNEKNIDTSFIQNKAHVVADKIEQEHALEKTPGRKIFYAPEEEKGYRFATPEEKKAIKKGKKEVIPEISDKRVGVKENKQFIQNVLIEATKRPECKSMADLKHHLDEKGIDIRFSTDSKTNEVRGISLSIEGYSCSGSEIGANWKHIEEKLKGNAIQNKEAEKCLPPQIRLKHLDANSNRLESHHEQIITKLRENRAELLNANEAVKLGLEPSKKIPKIKNEIRNQEALKVINYKEIEATNSEIKEVETKIENEFNVEVFQYKPILKPLEAEVKPIENNVKTIEKTEEIVLKIQEKKEELKDLSVEEKFLKMKEWNGTGNKDLIHKNKIKQMEVKQEIDDLVIKIPPQIKADPIGKEEEMKNEIIISEHKLLKVKAESKILEEKMPRDFKKLEELEKERTKLTNDIGMKKENLEEYSERVEELKSENKNLSNLQIDNLIDEQIEKEESRSNSRKNGMTM